MLLGAHENVLQKLPSALNKYRYKCYRHVAAR